MFDRIMVPVDLAHVDALAKALGAAADLSKHYSAPICYVGVTAAAPGSVAHTPAEFAAKLEAFAAEQASTHGIQTSAKAYTTHDPTTDLDHTLHAAVGEVGADLVVMASHVPRLADHLWPSHGGKLASHTSASVMIVR